MLYGGKKHSLKRNQSRGGFTLVEVLAALMLVAIVLPAAMKGVAVASQAASASQHRNEAASLAQSKLDELLATGVGVQSIPMSGDFGTDWPGYQWSAELVQWSPNGMNMSNGLGSNSTLGSSTPSGSSSSATSNTTAVANASSSNNTLQELDVHVTWNGPTGEQKSLTLSTLVYQSGNVSSSGTSAQ